MVAKKKDAKTLFLAYGQHNLKLCWTIFLTSGIRLVDGSYGFGRVEVYYSGEWGTVCDDSWDIRDARVACRQLGFVDAIAAYQGSQGIKDGTGRIWLDNVHCNGNELNLQSCRHNSWGRHNCRHYEDAGVRCDTRKGRTKENIYFKNSQSFTG